MIMNEDLIEKAALQNMPVAMRAKFKRTFGSIEGEEVLLYILVKIGGLYGLRGKADVNTRLVMDGKAEAAVEIMTLAGYSPFNLARRLMTLSDVYAKDLENETLPVQPPAAKPIRTQRPRARASSPIAASAIADADAFAGDPADPEPASAGTSAGSGRGVVE